MLLHLRRTLIPVLAVICLGAGFAGADPDPRYWRLDDVIDTLENWAVRSPGIVHLDTLGYSTLGEPIPMAVVSSAPGTGLPAVLIHGAQHSNEPNGTGAVMEQMRALVEGYGLNAEQTARVDGLELHFVPIVNVDGHRLSFGDHPDAADWRKTLRDYDDDGVADFPDDGVDPNRNWDWNWGEYGSSDPQKDKGPAPFSEPEVAALRDRILDTRPCVVVDYHSPVTIVWHDCVFRPWTGSEFGTPPDDAVLREVADLWTDATLTPSGNAFTVVPAYDTLPKEQNWVYGRTGALGYLMEISDHCWHTGADVDTIAVRVARGAQTLVDRVLQGPGLAVNVTDALTGEPLAAEVRILQMHHDAIGPRLSRKDNGAAHRLVRAGTYTVTAALDGYVTATRTVSVATGWQNEDIALERDATAVPDRFGSVRLLGRRPLTRGGSVRLAVDDGVRLDDVELLDLRGRRVAVLAEGAVKSASPSLTLPPQVRAGVYVVKGSVDGARWVRRVVVVD